MIQQVVVTVHLDHINNTGWKCNSRHMGHYIIQV